MTVAVISCSSLVAAAHTHTHTIISRILDGLLIDNEQWTEAHSGSVVFPCIENKLNPVFIPRQPFMWKHWV